MKLLICGSRNYPLHLDNLEWYIDAIYRNKIDMIITGGARGPDSVAMEWATKNNIECMVFYPDWDKHGRAAGPVRNKEMAQIADEGLAFWDGSSPGTKNTIEEMKKLKKIIRVVHENSLFNRVLD